MASYHRELGEEAFQRLREQIAAAAALCSDEQLLELADGLHGCLRRRRQTRNHRNMAELEGRTFA